MGRVNNELEPRQIAQRQYCPIRGFTGYWHWRASCRVLVELREDASRASGWAVVRYERKRRKHPAYQDRRERLSKSHWRHFRQRGPYEPSVPDSAFDRDTLYRNQF